MNGTKFLLLITNRYPNKIIVYKITTMKQTSIDWLIEKLMKGEFINNPDELIEQAKEMNKQEIIDAYCIGKYINVDDRQFGEQYYNKTFNQ